MGLAKLIIGELIFVIASVLIFRSLWTLMDQYFGFSYLVLFLGVGLALAVLAFIILNREVKDTIQKNGKAA